MLRLLGGLLVAAALVFLGLNVGAPSVPPPQVEPEVVPAQLAGPTAPGAPTAAPTPGARPTLPVVPPNLGDNGNKPPPAPGAAPAHG